MPGLRRLDRRQLREIEPHAEGVAALHSPATGIVDFPAVARALAGEVTERGGAHHARLRGRPASTAAPDEVVLRTADGEIAAAHAVFCAGAWSDRLAVAAGAPADPRIVPFRGAYLRLRPERRGLVRSLIYPVPDPALPFLGVHLTKHIHGDVLVGPTALMVGARDAYRLGRIRPRDLAATLAWPGTLRMARRFWRTGLAEMGYAADRAAFVRAAQRYVPELEPGDVLPGPSGVRAQALGRDGKLVDDFVISHTGRALHVRNAPSPAATSSLAIARLIADRAQEAFGLRPYRQPQKGGRAWSGLRRDSRAPSSSARWSTATTAASSTRATAARCTPTSGSPRSSSRTTTRAAAHGIVRGMHFQVGDGMAKLVRCARGAILDVVVDLRRGSPTFGEWEAFRLDEENLHQLYCPVGFAHGFVRALRHGRRHVQVLGLLRRVDRARHRLRRSRRRDRVARRHRAAGRPRGTGPPPTCATSRTSSRSSTHRC